MWAGYLALANQQAATNGTPAPGFINPTIYPLSLGNGDRRFPRHHQRQQWLHLRDRLQFVWRLGQSERSRSDQRTDRTGWTWLQPGCESVRAQHCARHKRIEHHHGHRYDGFSGSVTLSLSGLPNGVTGGFNPNPTSSTSTLTLTVAPNAAVGTSALTISGVSGSLTNQVGIQLTVAAAPLVTVTPASLTFAKEVVGETSAAKSVTVKNTGAATLKLSSIVASGDFAIQTNYCGAQLAVGQACLLKVTFTPTQVGARSGALTITDNAPNSPQTVPLSGTGTVPVTLTPATAKYPATKVGATSAAKTFTLANKQAVSLTGISAVTTGDFSVSATTCGTSLAAKSSCKISVVFTPTATGTRTGALQVSDSAVGSPQTSSLTGTGK